MACSTGIQSLSSSIRSDGIVLCFRRGSPALHRRAVSRRQAVRDDEVHTTNSPGSSARSRRACALLRISASLAERDVVDGDGFLPGSANGECRRVRAPVVPTRVRLMKSFGSRRAPASCISNASRRSAAASAGRSRLIATILAENERLAQQQRVPIDHLLRLVGIQRLQSVASRADGVERAIQIALRSPRVRERPSTHS